MRRRATRVNPRPLIGFGLAIGIIATAHVAAAQPAEPTPRQNELMREGTEAYKKKDYAAAIEAYDASLAIGPLNITLLNKGRSQQRLGDCQGAAKTYAQVLDAPAVQSPGPDTVRGALTRYREQLSTTCPGRLIVTCNPPETKLELTDPEAGLLDANTAGKALPGLTCVAPTELPPGDYAITARAHGQTRRRAISITGVKTTTLHIDIKPEVVVQTGVDPWLVAGWSTVGVSVAALGAGAFFSYQLDSENEKLDALARRDMVSRSELDDSIENADGYVLGQWIGYGTAVVALAGGIYMLTLVEEDEPEDGPSLLPTASPDGAGAALIGRF